MIKKIELSDEKLGEKLVKSFRETGFAVIQGHDIDPTLMRKVYRSWRSFFEMPLEDKLRHKYLPETQSGYFPVKEEKAKDATKADLKEFYHWYLDHEDWYDEEGNSDPTFELRVKLTKLALRLLREVDRTLEEQGVPLATETRLPSMTGISTEKTLFRILHYPPLKNFEGDVEGHERAAAHEDINLITLLPAATAPGLEVRDVQGNWHMVECNPGDIIVNVGDMLQEATSGYLPSTTHRVVADAYAKDESRYSMPLFLHPEPETRLSPRYTAQEYLEERLRQLGVLK